MTITALFFLGLAVAALSLLLSVRWWAMSWGTTEQELAESWPGDDVSPCPMETSTRGITINAPVNTVWAWLIQIGQDRAGFYSYR